MMIIPVRCFTCGKIISDVYEIYVQRKEMGEESAEILDSLDVTRYCCRRMILSHADLIDEVIHFG